MLIDNILITTDLVTILTELRNQLNAQGINFLNTIKNTPDNVMVSCPYHKNGQERKPSAGIRKSDGMFNCFACGEVHSLQEVISYCLGYTNDIIGKHGLQWLIDNFASLTVEDRPDIPLNLVRQKENKLIEYVPETELEKYRFYHNYMYKRKLTDKIIDMFDIGYDKDTDCITFPVRDKTGGTLFIARRSVYGKYFNYPCGVLKPVYGVYELYQQQEFPSEVIITESMLDALVCWCWGKYAVALNGTGSKEQFAELNKLPCRKFILATDNDSAGRQARVKIRNNLKNKIITEYIIPNGKKDLNDLTEEEFKNILEIF